MKFNDSVAGVCVGILYVWQLGVLVDGVVHLHQQFAMNDDAMKRKLNV